MNPNVNYLGIVTMLRSLREQASAAVKPKKSPHG